jgi:hypothetical protein
LANEQAAALGALTAGSSRMTSTIIALLVLCAAAAAIGVVLWRWRLD